MPPPPPAGSATLLPLINERLTVKALTRWTSIPPP